MINTQNRVRYLKGINQNRKEFNMADNELDPNIKGMCTECKTVMQNSWMIKNTFSQSGLSPSCPYCGGVVAVVDMRNAEAAKAQMDRERGL